MNSFVFDDASLHGRHAHGTQSSLSLQQLGLRFLLRSNGTMVVRPSGAVMASPPSGCYGRKAPPTYTSSAHLLSACSLVGWIIVCLLGQKGFGNEATNSTQAVDSSWA